MLTRQRLSRFLGVILVAILIPMCIANIFAADTRKYAGTKLVILSGSDGLPTERITGPYLEQFEKETGIKVEFTEMALDSLHSKLATLFAARSPEVDLVWTYIAWTAEFASAGYLEDITKTIDPAIKTDLNAAVNCVSYKGRIYGLPRFLSIRNFLYNKRMFKEASLDPNKPPKTWDEFIAAAKKLTRDTNGDGKIDQWGVVNQYGSPDSCFLTYQEIMVPAGATMFDNNDNPVFGGPEGLSALEKLAELHRAGAVDPASFGIASGPDKRSRFIQGYDAMEFGWAGDYAQSNNPAVSKVVGEIGFALIPGLKLESGAMEGSEGFAISKFSKNKKAALEFLKFQAQKDIQMDMCLRTGWMPVRTSVFAAPALRKANPLVAQVEQQMKYRVYRFGAPYATEVINAFGPEILKVIKLEKEPKQALADAVKAATEIVKRYK